MFFVIKNNLVIVDSVSLNISQVLLPGIRVEDAQDRVG